MTDKRDKNSSGTDRREFLKAAVTAGAGITFVGCSVADTGSEAGDQALAPRDPDTTQADFPRPVVVNGKRMRVIDVHAHCQVDDVWPMIEGRPELGGDNPYGPNPLTKANDVNVRLAAMDAMGMWMILNTVKIDV